LHGVCLPDETHFLTHLSDDSVSAATPPEGASDVRRLMPARDDRLVVYVQKQGASIGLSGEVLQIREKGIVITEVRLLDVAAVSIFGNVQISAQAIRELAGRGIPLFHLSYGGWLVSVTVPTPVRSIPVRVAQFRLLADEELRLDISRRMVFAKIHNARTLLRRNLKDVDEALRRDSVQLLRVARDEALRASSLESLLGIEGRAAAIYFSNFQKMIKPNVSGEFCIAGRNRRPPRDPVNALLSFAYSLLVRDAVHALFTTGLDPYVGFFHAVRHGRPALALDLMEEFRPLLADSVVLGVLNNREISSSHFIYRAGACLLSEAGRKCLIEAWERRMDCTATHPLFGYVVSYRRILEVQARLIVRFLQREISHYQPFLTR
jgi:CRISPR-associated protein Cas1